VWLHLCDLVVKWWGWKIKKPQIVTQKNTHPIQRKGEKQNDEKWKKQ
jgi:hypothetical protein